MWVTTFPCAFRSVQVSSLEGVELFSAVSSIWSAKPWFIRYICFLSKLLQRI